MYIFMKTNIATLRTHLAKLLERVQNGEEIEIQRRNVAIGKIVPIRSVRPNRTKLGIGKNSGKILGDITEPGLPLSDWEMLK